MEVQKRQFIRDHTRTGSALVLVIVITVLLASIGAMFMLFARIDQMASSAVVDNRDMDLAVDSVVNRIKSLLTEDLLGATNSDMQRLLAAPAAKGMRPNYANASIVNEPYDSHITDAWLASIEPDMLDDGTITPLNPNDDFQWPYISILWDWNNYPAVYGGTYYDPYDTIDITQWNGDPLTSKAYKFDVTRSIFARIVRPHDSTQMIRKFDTLNDKGYWGDPGFMIDYGARADADGDGVADSRWVPIPGQFTADGKQLYAAVRIIDNCAMLNLNVAHSIPANANGKYLSELDFERFLRGADYGKPERIQIARKRQAWNPDPLVLPDIDTYDAYHNNAVMNIENPFPPYTLSPYSLFDIGDELEIRNRFFLSSLAEAKFEKKQTFGISNIADYPLYNGVANFTLDSGGGYYSALKMVRDNSQFDSWKIQMNPLNFDDLSGGVVDDEFKYDRRHVCTFYSFDRNIRRREYPFVDPEAIAPDPTEDISKVDDILASAPGVFMPLSGRINIRKDIMSNTIQARRNILHLLYTFRAYFIDLGDDYKQAAKRSAQVVANMIDYLDFQNAAGTIEGPFGASAHADYGSQLPEEQTYIDRTVVKRLILEVSGDYFPNPIDIDDKANHWPISANTKMPLESQFDFGLAAGNTVYGFERQPFISEVTTVMVDNGSGGYRVDSFGMGLVNPYGDPIGFTGWRVKVGGNTYGIPAGIGPILAGDPNNLSYSVISGADIFMDLSLGGGLVSIELQRPAPDDPTRYITIDKIDAAQVKHLLTPAVGTYSIKRDDDSWGFTNSSNYEEITNGASGGPINPSATGYQMPVANNSNEWGTLGDLERVLFIGNEYTTNSNAADVTVAQKNATASEESEIRYDIKANPQLLEYISLINRGNGRIPGRININTATAEVIRAAIPPGSTGTWNPTTLADDIVTRRKLRPFMNMADLLDLPAFTLFQSDPSNNVGDTVKGEDIEERDWLLSLVANKFTVRSDVFTAYILVRIGTDGPQRRMIAIIDRSEVYKAGDKPRVVALHPVPDPR